MAETRLSGVLIAFIGVLIGIALLVAIADEVWLNRNLMGGTNTTQIDISSARQVHHASEMHNFTGASIALSDNCIYTFTGASWGNGSAMVRDTDYTVTLSTTGASNFVMLNSTTNWHHNASVTNITEWSYGHNCNYVDDGTSRTLLGLIIIFFVIGILALILKYILPQIREWSG
jgi:hypothetical protein